MKSKILFIFLSLMIFGMTACQLFVMGNADSSPTNTPQPSFTPEPTIELRSINEEWNLYINRELGFSMHIPKTMHRMDAECEQNEGSQVTIFTPGPGLVPVVVIEGDDRVYITSKTVIELSASKNDPSGISNYPNDLCEIKENTLEMLQIRDYSSYIWEIAFLKTESDADMERLVDSYYGECFSMGEIIALDDKDYFQVKIFGDQKPIEESKCLLRGGYTFLFSRELKMAATWKTGQSIHFASEPFNQGGYDGEMEDSFQFIPRLSDQ